MFRICLLIILIFTNAGVLYFEPLLSNDTNNVMLPEIEVIDTKPKSNSAMDFSPTTIIRKAQIEIVQPTQLSDILIYAPSVQISNYGGLGSQKTISIRGTGSMRTLVLLNGMPINSAQNSSLDLNTIPISMIDNIELMRGGASAIFGGNAIGGAVNIRADGTPTQLFNAGLSYGSFGEISANATGNYIGNGGINYISATADYINTRDNYPFTYNVFGKDSTFKRENADYSKLLLSVAGKGTIDNWNIWSRAIFSTTDRGVPGAILQGQVNVSKDRMKDNDYILIVNANRGGNTAVSAILKHSKTEYTEPSKTSDPISHFSLYDVAVNAKYGDNAFGLSYEILGSLGYATLNGDMLEPDVNSFVNRASAALGLRLEKNLELQQHNIKLTAGGRADAVNRPNDDVETAMSATIGGIYSYADIPIELRSNYSHNFRFPNFNEMYYRNYGTKDLLPEFSDNFNVGIDVSILNHIYMSIDAFYINTKDMITAIPTSPIAWSAKNLDRAVSRGVEMYISTNFTNYPNVILSYTRQQTLDKSTASITYNKQLPYTPNEIASYIISYSISEFEFGIKGNYTSFRYLQGDNDDNAVLPSYFTHDCFVSKQFKIADIDWKLRLGVQNIFDLQYEVISNYIMPCRAFQATISCEK
ncbi:MAG: TonB-dependent receptor [Ignavibacteria bacterium]|nr:TonB-dependent receptor [Ignavibacteria bacterium]